MLQVNSLLLVCIGNVCRSPMAEQMFKNIYPQKKIASAGLSALVGQGADSLSIKVMQEIGGGLESHVAQQLDADLVREFDLILTMTQGQAQWILKNWNFTRGKVFCVGHWLQMDIDDPYKMPIEYFLKARNEISACIEQWRERLV